MIVSCASVASLVVGTGAAVGANAPRAAARPRAGAAATPGDFNGDGFGDLAVGAPGEDVNGVFRAGAVYVLFGSSTGLTTTGVRRITKASPGISGIPRSQGFFGTALAVGDFDSDGHSDLAIGDSNRVISSKTGVGAAVVIPGSAGGLDLAGSSVFDETSFGGVPETDDHYGQTLTSGDYDKNGVADLAIGGPTEGVNGHSQAGAVGVLYGTHGTGLGTGGAQLFHEGKFPGESVTGSVHFGESLASGDLDGDGTDDLLAHGLHQANGGGCFAVFRVPGSSTGLKPSSAQTIDPSILPGPGCNGAGPGSGGEFGHSMAVGDFSGDGIGDLAAGASDQNTSGKLEAGAFYIVLGGPTGLTPTGARRITENTAGVPGDPQKFGNFAEALAAGNFGNNAPTDLAVLATNQDKGGFHGGTDVFYGRSTGFDATNVEYLSHGTAGMPAPNQDRWVLQHYAADLGNGTKSDLVGGAQTETVNGHFEAGAVYVTYGTPSGLDGAGTQRFTTATAGIPGDPADVALFGIALPT
jgi:hypothetical protein